MHVEIIIEWTTVLWHFDNQFSIGEPFRHDFHCSLTSSLIFISRTAADSEFNAVTSKKSLSSLNNYNRRKRKDKPIRTWRKYVKPLSTSCADNESKQLSISFGLVVQVFCLAKQSEVKQKALGWKPLWFKSSVSVNVWSPLSFPCIPVPGKPLINSRCCIKFRNWWTLGCDSDKILQRRWIEANVKTTLFCSVLKQHARTGQLKWAAQAWFPRDEGHFGNCPYMEPSSA